MPASLNEAFMYSNTGTSLQSSPQNHSYNSPLTEVLSHNTGNVSSPYQTNYKVESPNYQMPQMQIPQQPMPQMPQYQTSSYLMPQHYSHGHDCHDLIAKILSCPTCRRKLKLILDDDQPIQSGGNIIDNIKGIKGLYETVTNLIVGIALIIIINRLLR